MSVTWPTPEMLSIERRTTLSASSLASRIGLSLLTATRRTGAAPRSILLTTGGSIPFGRSWSTVWILSRTSCAPTSAFLSRSNWTVTIETPSLELERSSSMPEMVLTAPSILSVMSVSTSSGAAPSRRVVMTTNGRSTFGNWSSPRRL